MKRKFAGHLLKFLLLIEIFFGVIYFNNTRIFGFLDDAATEQTASQGKPVEEKEPVEEKPNSTETTQSSEEGQSSNQAEQTADDDDPEADDDSDDLSNSELSWQMFELTCRICNRYFNNYDSISYFSVYNRF